MKPTPIFDVDELPTAHTVRKLRPCCHCDGIGLRESMVYISMDAPTRNPGVRGSLYHPQCYLSAYGFRVVTALPLSERDKFRLQDLNVRQMRRLLDLRHPDQLNVQP